MYSARHRANILGLLPLAIGDRRSLLFGLAVFVSLATVALFVATLRGTRQHDPPLLAGSRRHDRRRAHPNVRDPREALALVGNALAATHNPRALLPLILEVVTEATGARGGQLLKSGEEIGWIGEMDGKGEPLALDLETDDVSGTTTLVLYPPRRGFEEETRKLAEWLAAQAGIALENARLHEKVQRQASTDELTSLVNRRQFLEALEAELERARVFDAPLSVVIADLDDFKRVNDRYGHQAGDEALKAFGNLLRIHLREVDVAARLGGEEFAVLLPETGIELASVAAGRIRTALGGVPITVSGGERISLTASFGIAELVPGQSSDELLRRADSALYEAKNDGKNRIRVADPKLLS